MMVVKLKADLRYPCIIVKNSLNTSILNETVLLALSHFKTIAMRVFLIPVFLLIIPATNAQSVTWSTPVTVASSVYQNLHPRIVLNRSGNPLVLWGNSGSNKTYFSRWNGTAFSMPVTLNPTSIPVFAADWAGPDIASHGDTVYAVFKQTPETDSTKHIFITTSFDGGQNFSTPVRVDNIADSLSRFPIVTTDDMGNPIVAFMKFDPGFGNARYVFTKSPDYGNTFTPDVLASGTTGDVCDCCPAAILSSGNNKAILYRNNLSNIRTSWAGISTNNGNSFNNFQVDSTSWMIMACPSSGPDGVIAGDTLYSTFMSQATGTARIYQSKTALSTGLVSSTSLLSSGIAGLSSENYPRMASSGNEAAIAWRQVVSGTTRISMSLTDNVIKGFPGSPETVAIGSALKNADIAMTPGVVHVVWEDDNTGTVMYRKGIYASSVPQIIHESEYINVFPNPAASYVFISRGLNISRCTLLDIAGQQTTLKSEQANNKLIIHLDNITAGMYYILLTDTNGKTYYSKLIVQPD
jgi:hypothetical protein